MIASCLGTSVSVIHVKRMSHDLACLADKLSRNATLEFYERKCLNETENVVKVPELENWLEHPSEDWELPHKLLDYVIVAMRKRM